MYGIYLHEVLLVLVCLLVVPPPPLSLQLVLQTSGKLSVLPVEMLELINEFAQTVTLSHVCRYLRARLSKHYRVQGVEYVIYVVQLGYTSRLRTRVLRAPNQMVGDTEAIALSVLRKAQNLCTLHLLLSGNSISAVRAKALATLKTTPELHTLSIGGRGPPDVSCSPG